MEKFTHMRLRRDLRFPVNSRVTILDGDVIAFPCGVVTTGLYIFMLTANQASEEEINDWWYSWLAEKEKRELDSFMDEEDKQKEVIEEQQSKKSKSL